MIFGEHRKQPKITKHFIEKTHLFQEVREIALETDEIHIWLISLKEENQIELQQILSASEKARADRFRLAKDKTQYIVARAFLRMILSKYLSISPEKIEFEYNKFGKPFIKDATKRFFKFNMSHSHELAIYAVTLVNEVGVDIEVINPSIVDDDLAAQTLTKYELECFKNLPLDQRIELFYKCWTGKEAFTKAQGDGLITNPNEIEMLSNKTIFIDKCERNLDVTETLNYSYFVLPPISGYSTGLVVMEETKKHLRLFQAII